jgi:hypothetical protein
MRNDQIQGQQHRGSSPQQQAHPVSDYCQCDECRRGDQPIELISVRRGRIGSHDPNSRPRRP